MKKSITIVGGKVPQHAYIVRDIDVDKIQLEKYNVECREDISKAWLEEADKCIEVVIQDKISTITHFARAPVLEKASKLSGKIIKDIVLDRAKRGKKVYISELILFEEPSIQ